MFPEEGGIKYKKVILVTCSFNPWRFKSHLLLPLIATTVWLYWPYRVICHSVLKVPLRCSNIKSSTTTNTRGIFWPQPNCLPSPFSSPPLVFLLCYFLIDLFSICLSAAPSRAAISFPHPTWDARWDETAANTLYHKRAHTHTHTRRRLSSIHCCLYPKKGFLTGDDSAVACSHSVPVSPSHTHTFTLASTCLSALSPHKEKHPLSILLSISFDFLIFHPPCLQIQPL